MSLEFELLLRTVDILFIDVKNNKKREYFAFTTRRVRGYRTRIRGRNGWPGKLKIFDGNQIDQNDEWNVEDYSQSVQTKARPSTVCDIHYIFI